MYTFLSFPLAEDTPAAGGRKPLAVAVDESIDAGHLGNTCYFTAWNHAGTHVDAPGHMLAGAKKIADFPADYFIFEHPLLLDVPKHDSELITSADLSAYAGSLHECDVLLLRTGFIRYRASDPLRYRDRNPGLSADVARYLSTPAFPNLRAVGIDTISMAAAAHVLEGVEAHKVLFSKSSARPVLLIEDMNIAAQLHNLRRVVVAPLLIAGLDSSPCTVIAEL